MSQREEPTPEFRSYYGRPILKEPAWRVPDVPLYLFLGGTAGASASTAALADLTGRPGLARAGRIAAIGCATASVGALIHDLGRPQRFLNMLRVIKPTSPLSVGSWILAPFSTLAGAAMVSDLTGLLRGPGRAAGLASGVVGTAMCTYTAVLLADTAIPSWHDAHRELPFLFAGSAMASAAGALMIAAPVAEQAPVRNLAAIGGAVELAAAHRVETGLGLVGEPYSIGKSGRLLRAGRALTAAGIGLSVAGGLVSRRSRGLGRAAAVLSGTALVAAGLCTRFGVYEAGVASARDPKYVVVPQRERVSSRMQ
ncbi:MAG TPA: NrfD/PsrC family molybdoenzyme membrane anchor subunit [Streptosporangiaceae bacterium]|jgi:formate-dependent nitrite reductase membrane component NrfD